MDPKIIHSRNNPNIAHSGLADTNQTPSEQSLVSPNPIAPEAQAAPTLADNAAALPQNVQVVEGAATTSFDDLQDVRTDLQNLKNEDFTDSNVRKQVFDILNKVNSQGVRFFDAIYRAQNEATITQVGAIISKMFNTCYFKESSSVSLFELLEVIRPDDFDSTENYILNYCHTTKESINFAEASNKAIEQNCMNKTVFYFIIGFLAKNSASLEALSILMKDYHGVKTQLEATILTIFSRVLDQLSRNQDSHLQAIHKDAYNNTILSVCEYYPYLLELRGVELIQYGMLTFAEGHSAFFYDLLRLQVRGYCFFEYLYLNINKHNAYKENKSQFNESELKIVGPLFDMDSKTMDLLLKTELTHFKQYLLNLDLSIFSRPQISVYKNLFLYLSLITKDLECIHRFKDLQSCNYKYHHKWETKTLHLCSLLFNHLFGFRSIEDATIAYERGSFEDHRGGLAISQANKELFFNIINALQSCKVLEQPDWISHILAQCLAYDKEIQPSQSLLDEVLAGFQKLGLKLDGVGIDSKSMLHIAVDLKNLDLIVKLVQAGANPFLLDKNGCSVYTHELFFMESIRENLIKKFSQENKTFAQEWTAKDISILKLAGLEQHEAVLKSYNRLLNLEKIKAGSLKKHAKSLYEILNKKDSEGRNGLMVLVLCNQDIEPLLPYIKIEELLSKDTTGKTVIDYADRNQDKQTLRLLEEHRRSLQEKVKHTKGTTNIYRKAAASFAKWITPQAPQTQSPPAEQAPSALKNQDTTQPMSKSQKKRERQKRAREAKASGNASPAPEINLYYDEHSGNIKTETKEARKAAQEAIEKAAEKKKKKEEKTAGKGESVKPNKEKAGLFNKAKQKMRAVAEALDTVKKLAADPGELARSLAERLQKKANPIERLRQSERALRLSKMTPVPMLEDGFWLGSFVSLSGLANEALGKGLLSIPSNGVVKTLEAMDNALKNTGEAINRYKVLECLQWVVGGKLESGHGSHLNLRWHGGGLTIPRNKDGSDHADIVYIKQAAQKMAWALRFLLLDYEASQSTVSSSEPSEGDEWNLDSTSEASAIEADPAPEDKDETPEASASSNEDAS